jgi:hypothetical protein
MTAQDRSAPDPAADRLGTGAPGVADAEVCLAVATSHLSPVIEDIFTAAQTAAAITAECGNYEMWQLTTTTTGVLDAEPPVDPSSARPLEN